MPTDPAVRAARYEAERLRGTARLHAALGTAWIVFAVLQWSASDRLWLQVAWTALAVLGAAAAVGHRRRAREAAARLEVLRSGSAA